MNYISKTVYQGAGAGISRKGGFPNKQNNSLCILGFFFFFANVRERHWQKNT